MGNVTNKYIGLGVDQKQTISFLRKELQHEKEKVQKLTIEIDELNPKSRKQSFSISNAIYPFPNNYEYNYDDDGVDDEKYCKTPESQNKSEDEDICNVKFEQWLCDTVKLGQYLSAFRKSECNDIRMIEFFEEAAIEKEIGIKKLFHRKLIMKKANEFKKAQHAFSVLLDENKETKVYKERLESQGIVTLNELRNCVKSKDDLMNVLDESKGEKCIDAFWNVISLH